VLIIFDLDGTLIDSSKDLAIAMNQTREHFGMQPLDPALIYSYVGNGVPALVRRALGGEASGEMVEEALKFFLEFYGQHAIDHTRSYPGVAEAIRELSGAQNKLAILTNKPVRISLDIIGALNLQRYFFRVCGGDSFASKKPDPVGILALMDEAGATRQQTLLVGDSGVDIRTARNAGIRSCGVSWGFQPEGFQTDPPDVLIHEARELPAVVNGAAFSPE